MCLVCVDLKSPSPIRTDSASPLPTWATLRSSSPVSVRRTTAPAKLALGKPLSWADRTIDVHLKRHGPPIEAVVVAVTNDRLDFGTWGRILGVSRMADTGVLTGGGGSRCWSRFSESKGAQSYDERNRLRLWYATTKRWSVQQNGRG